MFNDRVRGHYGERFQDLISSTAFTICGAGAIGSILADSLARQGATNVLVIDNDRVERPNIGTQVYRRVHVGHLKVTALRGIIYETNGQNIQISDVMLTQKTVSSHLSGSDIVIDAFDNGRARGIVYEYCLEHNIPCLHLGMNGNVGGARWNKGYLVPDDDDNDGDVCNVPSSRNLIYMLVGMGLETVFRFLLTGNMYDRAITMSDMKIWDQ